MPVARNLPQDFADEMGALLGPDFPRDIVAAVSGGGDSMAMLHLVAGWARIYGVNLRVVTVDHGLRDASAAEANMVGDECAHLGLTHKTLRWSGWDGQGNLQDAARHARHRLIRQWAGADCHVLLAHTQDDQAETVMMRLLRGSGVDGLAGMAALHSMQGLTFVRPLLNTPRDALRHYCKTLKIPFVDDPSNDDAQFERVRIRKLIAQLGVETTTLAQTARQMGRARKALEHQTAAVFAHCATAQFTQAGYVALWRDRFANVPREIQLRVMATALMQVAQNPYRPRLTALETSLDALLSGGITTLHGCVVLADKDSLLICRELQAAPGPVATDQLWDARWQMDGPHDDSLRIAALGDALSDCADWRDTGHPRAALRASPAIWHDDRLIAAPMAGLMKGWTARIVAK